MTTPSNVPGSDGPRSGGPAEGPGRNSSAVVAVSILFILAVAVALGVVWLWNDADLDESATVAADGVEGPRVEEPAVVPGEADVAASGPLPEDAMPKARPSSADRLDRELATIDADRRRDQEELAPDQEVEPDELARYERRLRERLRQRRALAEQGDLLDAELVAHLRSIVQGLLAGPDGNDVLATLMEENPGAVELEVNEPYPADQVATVPPALLQRFPVLPEGIEYRFAGCSLFLLERDTELILDYVPDCLW